MPQEVFRQDDKVWEKEPDPQEWMERRMKRPHSVDGGFVYEVDGILYFLDKDFKKASPLCDLRQLMGDFYSFSPDTSRTCDVTAAASRLIACTDEGLYEYDLESGEWKLLGAAACCVVGFLDADSLFYFNFDKQDDQNVFEIYRLSSGQRQDLEAAGAADWEMIVLDEDGHDTWPVRYPK